MVVPIAISTKPVFTIFPERANTFVPFDDSVPTELNQSAPITRISATLARVSTLLIMVGLPNNPLTAGKGGRGRGIPRKPSILFIKAVSSPHTKAPAPILIFNSKLNLVPKIFLPNNPSFLACSMAIFKRVIAKGYSARI